MPLIAVAARPIPHAPRLFASTRAHQSACGSGVRRAPHAPKCAAKLTRSPIARIVPIAPASNRPIAARSP
ncbi:MAG TPA: hypothetical protein DCQ98_04035 [Planctomycetaceae bacterium]|nr:hypothetical protein [Planctomycetaceae bacterium]